MSGDPLPSKIIGRCLCALVGKLSLDPPRSSCPTSRLKLYEILVLGRPWWHSSWGEVCESTWGDKPSGVTDGIWGLQCCALLHSQVDWLPGEPLYLQQEVFEHLWVKSQNAFCWHGTWETPSQPSSSHAASSTSPPSKKRFLWGWNFPSLAYLCLTVDVLGNIQQIFLCWLEVMHR